METAFKDENIQHFDIEEESHSLHVVFEQESRESSVDSKVETIPEVASKLSVKNLKDNFEVVKVEAAIQCSGNRRSDFNQFKVCFLGMFSVIPPQTEKFGSQKIIWYIQKCADECFNSLLEFCDTPLLYSQFSFKNI